MNLIKVPEMCCGCNACSSICNKKCVVLKKDQEGFIYPQINIDNCINCSLCEKVCPMTNELSVDNCSDTICYAVCNKDKKIRLKSSSGAFFWILTEYVISQNGVVFGAKLDADLHVVHGYAETLSDCTAFIGSKYMQSNIGNAFLDAREFLNNGRLVLFSGTGCQISGLRNFLKKRYNNLICQDIACHGVTSELLFDNYREYLEKKYGTEITCINFRDKSSGWKGYSVRADFRNNYHYIKNAEDDLFMRAYRSKYYLRPSCYECKFRGIDRASDFTLADFWGVDRLMPEIDDDCGTSLVFIHSDKGRQIFEKINDKIISKMVDVQNAVEENPSLIVSFERPKSRGKFIDSVKKTGINKAVRKYCKKKITVYELKIKIVKLIKKTKRTFSL